MSKIKGKKNISGSRKNNNRGKVAKKSRLLYNPMKHKKRVSILPAFNVLGKPGRMIKNGARKVFLPQDVKTKLFENLRGKHIKVDQNQLDELMRKGVDMNVEENILGFQPLLMLKQRYKELCKIHCEEISNCVRGAWFKEGRYGATFLSPGHF
uniref:Nucleolar protein 16 n=1 Tax=Strongyloides venezuelensis TaxID=75913 RepID=A0A0K0FLK4_STRVS